MNENESNKTYTQNNPKVDNRRNLACLSDIFFVNYFYFVAVFLF